MAQVPYNPVPTVEPTGLGAPSQSLSTNADMFGGGVAQGIGAIGGALEEHAQRQFEMAVKFQQLKNETDVYDASRSYADYVSQKDMEFKRLKGQAAVDAYPQYHEAIKTEFERRANALGSPMAQQQFRREANYLYDRTVVSLGNYTGNQIEAANVAARAGKIKAIDNFTTLHADDPTAIEEGIKQTVIAEHDAAQDEGITNPDIISARTSQSVGNLISHVIEATYSQGVTVEERRAALTRAEKLFEQYGKATVPGLPGTPLFDAPQRDEITARLQSRGVSIANAEEAEERRREQAANVAAAHLRIGISHAFTNATALVTHGFLASNLPSDAQIDAAYPNNPEQASEIKEQVQDLRTISGYLGVLPGATPEQIIRLKQEVAPDPAHPETFARRVRLSNGLNAALAEIGKNLKEDPAGYLLQSHAGYNIPTYADLQAQYRIASQNPSAPAAHIPYAGAGETAFGVYAQHVEAIQATMGVPEAQRHVLPAIEAQSMADDIAANPSNARQKLQDAQKQFGAQWPKVWRDMTSLGKLPAEYQLIGALDNKQDAELLARAMQEGKNGKNIDDLLSPQAKTQIHDAVFADPRLNRYLFTLDASGSDDSQKMGLRDATLKLAYARAFYNGNNAATTASAAAGALQSVVGGYDLDFSSARIPLDVASTVKSNARAMLSSLNATKVFIPEASPDARTYIEDLQANSTWVTAPTADALWLKDRANRWVRTKQGEHVMVPFNAPPIRGSFYLTVQPNALGMSN